jgi:hypothetical protein
VAYRSGWPAGTVVYPNRGATTLVEEEGPAGAGTSAAVGRGRRVGEEMRVGEGRTSAQPSWPAVGDDDAHVSRRDVSSGRSGASERGGASKRGLSSGRGASGTGAAKTEEERRGGDLGENG